MSVIVPAYNAAAFIGECLASVRMQAGDFRLDIVVVDDGSTDTTAQVAAKSPDVRCLRQPNRGPAAARNRGIAAAHGEYIAWLDADDIWPAGKLDMQLQILRQHPNAAMVFGDCRQFDDNGLHASTLFESSELGHAAWGAGPLLPDAYDRLLGANFITTGSVVMRREVLEATGGFDEGLRLVEDLDLWLRVARRFPVAWCSDICLLRRRHQENTSRDAEAMSLSYLEVLYKQFNSGEDRDDGRRARIRTLAAAEYRQLARSALTRGDVGLALRRTWHAIVPPWKSRRCAMTEARR